MNILTTEQIKKIQIALRELVRESGSVDVAISQDFDSKDEVVMITLFGIEGDHYDAVHNTQRLLRPLADSIGEYIVLPRIGLDTRSTVLQRNDSVADAPSIPTPETCVEWNVGPIMKIDASSEVGFQLLIPLCKEGFEMILNSETDATMCGNQVALSVSGRPIAPLLNTNALAA